MDRIDEQNKKDEMEVLLRREIEYVTTIIIETRWEEFALEGVVTLRTTSSVIS